MKQAITPASVVALTWRMHDAQGQELDVLDEPVEFLLGGSDLLASMEEALLQHQVGDTLHLHLEPQHAFGHYESTRVFLAPRAAFPERIETGMVFDGHALPAACGADIPREALYVLTDIYPEHVVLDGNHPLAGMALRVRLTVHAARAATEEEVGRGSAGAGFFTTVGAGLSA